MFSRANGRDAASLACVCSGAAAAAQESKWRSAVRVGPGGFVLEPASGAFDVTVAPGEPVQAAIERCPPGGSVLLLPGKHKAWSGMELWPSQAPSRSSSALSDNAIDKEVHVFGRGRAKLIGDGGFALAAHASRRPSSVDGLVLRRRYVEEEGYCDDYSMGPDDPAGDPCVDIDGRGRITLQFCDISRYFFFFFSFTFHSNPVRYNAPHHTGCLRQSC